MWRPFEPVADEFVTAQEIVPWKPAKQEPAIYSLLSKTG